MSGLRVCSWEDVSFSEAERLLELSADTEKLQAHLARLLPGGRDEKQAAIELDLFSYAILFCKKQQFSQEQLSAFFSILKSVHAMCSSTPYDNLQETSLFFRDLLLRHSVQRPPFSCLLFSLPQVKAITDYVLATYFRHFKMYKFAFTERVQLSLSLQYSGEPEPACEEEEELDDQLGIDAIEPEEEVEKEQEGERGVAEEENKTEELLAPEQERVRTIITSALTSHLKQLKVTVEEQMREHERRVSDKLSQLEAISDHKAKKK